MKTKDHAGSAARNLYTQVTDRIIAELEEGRLPWVQPWDRATASAGLPCNAGTGRGYSGINILILWATVIERGYGEQAWLTYRQCEALGGHVRKGEQGTTICYADRFTPKAEQERASSAGDDARQVAFLKRFTVFNIDQCEGLPDSLAGIAAPLPEREVSSIQGGRRVVLAFIATVYAQGTPKAVKGRGRKVAGQLRPSVPKLAGMIDAAEQDMLAYMSFSASASHQAAQHNDEWAVQRGRYMTLESVAQLSDD